MKRFLLVLAFAATSVFGQTGGWVVPGGGTTGNATTVNGASVPASQSCLGSNGSSQLIAGTCSGGSGITVGTLASRPSTCSAGSLYFATDLPAAQQITQCTATNTWLPNMSVGASGALAITSGLLDITSLVPLKAAANAFTGLSSFAVGQDMTEQASGTTPAAGNLHIYANTDHTFHQVNSSGTDTPLGGGSATQIVDTNGNFTVKSGTATTSAVNGICGTNAATAGIPTMKACGSDTNIELDLDGKAGGGIGIGNGTDNHLYIGPNGSSFAGAYLSLHSGDSLNFFLIGTGVVGSINSTGDAAFHTSKVVAVTVGSLGTCNGGAEGTFSAVTDAAATPVYNAIVASRGSTHIPVYCNGTNWVNH